MLAFHNDKKVKAQFTKRLRDHHKADDLIQGSYWSNGKGCAVGCTLEDKGGQGKHSEYETQLGIPRVLAKLEDRIFERLTPAEAKDFAVNFLKVIPVGADLTHVWEHFMAWLMDDMMARPRRKELPNYVKDFIQLARGLFKEQAEGNKVAWEAARGQAWKARSRAAAYAADAYAAYADAADAAYAAAYAADAAAYAAYAYAADAAYAAAYAADAADAAAYAADAAAYAAYADAAYAADADAAYAYAAYADARREFWTRASKQLLKLLKEAPRP